MNAPAMTAPCADYEHDLVELHDGALPDERARIVRGHLGHCARCQAWAREFAAVDARLEQQLPRPALSAEFELRLRERLAGESRRTLRGGEHAATDAEYRALRTALDRGLRLRVAAAGLAAAIAAFAALIVVPALLPDAGSLLASLSATQRITGFGLIGGVIAVAGLAWSATQGILAALRTGT